MAFVNSIKDISQGFGSHGQYLKREGVATNVGTVVTTIPAAGGFSPGVTAGRIRVKTVSVVATGTVQLGIITATDGVTVMTILPQQTALAANALLDVTVEYRLDIKATSFSVTIIAGTANSVHDFEVGGNC